MSKIKNFHFLSEISDFDHIFITFKYDLWVNSMSQNGILRCSFVDLKDFWKFNPESKLCQNWKFSWPRSLATFQILTTFSSLSIITCERIPSLKMVLWSVFVLIWRIFGSLRLSQNFVKNWKFSWPVLSKISDFDHFFITFNYDLWVNSMSENGILRCSFVDLKDFLKFEDESKFCQKLKIFMIAVVSEISNFDHFFITFKYDLWVNFKTQTVF